MDIKSLLEEYAVIMDDMEDNTGLNQVVDEVEKEEKNESLEESVEVNEEKDLAEEPADMEQAEYKDMKIKEPELDDQPLAKKLLKQCEEIETVEVEESVEETTEEIVNEEEQVVEEKAEEVVESAEINEEYGEDFYHYASYNKCKDVKEVKNLIKTIRDDIKDAKEEDNKDLVSELKQDLNKAKALLKAAQDLKKNENVITEVSKEVAQYVNDIRNKEAVLNPEDEEKQEKAEKSNKLLRKWKKVKGIEEAKTVESNESEELDESKKVGE